ncbi:MAG TPA: NUDIX domain-containing protein [Candidatus Paceibacterota bacterium]|nr:NUDIX domain-containing protein [Candidatus Paceibacterota bacterium]
MNSEEIVDLVDKRNRVIGQKKRSELGPFDLRRAVHIILMTLSEEIIFQVRGANENDLYENMYDTAASGHVHAGEETREAARRELREETGIDCVPGDLCYLTTTGPVEMDGTFIDPVFRSFYLFVFLGNSHNLTPEEGKVAGFVRIDLDKFVALKNGDPETERFIPAMLGEPFKNLMRMARSELRQRYPKVFDPEPNIGDTDSDFDW